MSSVFSSIVHAIGFGGFFKADERDLSYPSDMLNDLDYNVDELDCLAGLSKAECAMTAENPYGVGFRNCAISTHSTPLR